MRYRAANSTMISTCDYCNQLYCQECTDAEKWALFCSKACEAEAEKEADTAYGEYPMSTHSKTDLSNPNHKM